MGQSVIIFLIENLFDLLILVLVLRLLLQWANADDFNPVMHVCLVSTQWLVRPLQYLLPRRFQLDLAVVAAILVMELIKTMVISSLGFDVWPNWPEVLLWVLADTVYQFLTLWFYAILLRALLSWIAPSQHHVLSTALMQLTEPLLKPVRKTLPRFHGFDFSALFIMLALQLVKIGLVMPLLDSAMKLSITV
jgi:YggT family protein